MNTKQNKPFGSGPTEEHPLISAQRDTFASRKEENERIVNLFRDDLNLILQDLTQIADHLSDPSIKLRVFNSLLPTAKALSKNEMPSSVRAELERIKKLTEGLDILLPGSKQTAVLERSRAKLQGILATIKQ